MWQNAYQAVKFYEKLFIVLLMFFLLISLIVVDFIFLYIV